MVWTSRTINPIPLHVLQFSNYEDKKNQMRFDMTIKVLILIEFFYSCNYMRKKSLQEFQNNKSHPKKKQKVKKRVKKSWHEGKQIGYKCKHKVEQA